MVHKEGNRTYEIADHTLGKRLSIVMPYLYPDLENELHGDYHLQNDSDGNGTYIVWHTDKAGLLLCHR